MRAAMAPAATRMTSFTVTDGVSTTSYIYGGDGDHVTQTVDGVKTSYVIDTASPLSKPYFAGASAHPCTGLPTAMFSGRLSAQRMLGEVGA
jgi:phytoene dehydrogenase-like protein